MLTSSCATIGGLYGCGEILRRHGLAMRILKEERRMRRQGNLRKILGVQRCARDVKPTGNRSVGKDRKSVVGGKRVSGSVDHGGGGIIKNKNTNTTNQSIEESKQQTTV